MEMQQVRYFVTLAELRNFTRAAEACNVTQPAFSRAIRLRGVVKFISVNVPTMIILPSGWIAAL